MCWGLIASAAQQAAGVGVGMLAAEHEYDANKEALEYNIAQLERNKELKEFQATDALARGEKAVSAHRTAVRQLQGQQRATFAGSGIVADAGSAGDVQREAGYYGELDAMTIRYNAQKEAYGHQVAATDLQSQIQFAQTEKSNLRWKKDFDIGTSILGGASRFGSQAYNYYRG